MYGALPTKIVFPPYFFSSSETDDYAEIIDEEDTYTMPSSKHMSNAVCSLFDWSLACVCMLLLKIEFMYI